jgi:hypothetical protein
MADYTNLDPKTLVAPPITATIQMRSLIVGAIGAVVCLIGLFMPGGGDHLLRAWLVAFMFWLGLSLGCLGLLMLTYMVGGWWGFVPRRIFLAAAQNVYLMFVFFLPILIWRKSLYIWMTDEFLNGLSNQEAHLWKFASYLTQSRFIVASIIYFLVWMSLVYMLSRLAAERNNSPGNDRQWRLRFQKVSAPGLILYCLAMTFAAFDWVMSLDPHWYSTIYGMIFLSGQALSALSFTAALCIVLSKTEPMSLFFKKDIMHDIGKLMLAFTMFWAYVSFSQFLIIWAGNLPEEIHWFLTRLDHGWQYVAIAIILFHFVMPFSLLLSKDVKKNRVSLTVTAILIMFMRYVDLYWYIKPNFQGGGNLRFGWLDIASFATIGGIWMMMFLRNLRSRPLFPVNDPLMDTALEHLGDKQFQHQH